jgi:hypothetical protein
LTPVPTITKPKFPIDPSIPLVTIAPKQRRNICESAGLDPSSRAGKAFLGRVERAMSWHRTMLARIPQRSLPAHTVAALKPIAKQAADLARLLDPANLPIEVGATLDAADVMRGAAHRYLLDLATAAEQSIQKLKEQSRPGHHKRLIAETREQALNDLESIYLDLACEECGDDDRAEFLSHCVKCLKS